MDTLEAVLCDGTNVNVGNRTGFLSGKKSGKEASLANLSTSWK